MAADDAALIITSSTEMNEMRNSQILLEAVTLIVITYSMTSLFHFRLSNEHNGLKNSGVPSQKILQSINTRVLSRTASQLQF